MARIGPVLRLVVRDRLLFSDLPKRVPEQAVMNSSDSVAGFDAAGENYLLPVYDFNARAIARLAGGGSHVLDLGSGSGQFLAYLALHRPDLQITGVELSEEMVETGRKMLKERGLASRVRLILGDMRNLTPFFSEPVDLVSSIFSLHHLETQADLAACLAEVANVVSSGASLWLFDHVRPRREQTVNEFPGIFTPDAAVAFRLDSTNSLRASWSYQELSTELGAAGLARINSTKARLLPFYQIHWLSTSRRREAQWVEDADSPPKTRKEARQFARLFRSAPGR